MISDKERLSDESKSLEAKPSLSPCLHLQPIKPQAPCGADEMKSVGVVPGTRIYT